MPSHMHRTQSFLSISSMLALSLGCLPLWLSGPAAWAAPPAAQVRKAKGPVAPTKGTWQRVNDVRLKDAPNAGYTAEQYLAESILYPNNYVVPGGTKGLMPQNFGDQLGLTELKNIIAYLASQ